MNIFKFSLDWKYRHFRKKLYGVKAMVADLEFKRFKTREIREEVRQEYDAQKSKLAVTETQVKGQLKTPEKICPIHNQEQGKEKIHKDHGVCICEYIDNHIDIGEIERLYDRKELLNRDITRFLGQIKSLDLEVNGSNATVEYPDGVQGITQQLEALRELQGMLSSYIRTL